jgi:penicillin amidase
MSRNPRNVDPESGFIATANHDFYAEGDESMRRRLPGDFASPWRVRRIRRLLASRDDWSIAATVRMQTDVVSARAIAAIKLLRPELEQHRGPSARRLLRWDGRMDPSSPAPTVFSWLLLELGRAVVDEDLSIDGDRTAGLAVEPLMRLLAGGMNETWWDDPSTPRVEGRSVMIARALDAVDRRGEPSPWGELHRVVFRHPLTEMPVAGRLLERTWGRGPLPAGGDNVTINATYWSHRRPFDVGAMPALRMVMDVGDWDRSVAVTPLGQSGRPWSSHYADQIETWRRGEALPMPFSTTAVEAATEARLVLRPTQ